MYRLCIFDLDGTLASTLESMAYSANLVLGELGLKKQPADAFRYFAGDGAMELSKRCLKAAGGDLESQLALFYKRYREEFARYCMYQVKPYPGIMKLLHSLKEHGIRVTVLSNKPHDQAVDVVESLFGKGMLDAVQGQTDAVPRKPSPIGAVRLMDRFHVSPEECLYIGDTATDMETGRNASIRTIGVLWGFRDREELTKSGASVLAEKPEEILEIALEENESL